MEAVNRSLKDGDPNYYNKMVAGLNQQPLDYGLSEIPAGKKFLFDLFVFASEKND
jgi:hypothetical protein